mgnify:CR=1 FL=1
MQLEIKYSVENDIDEVNNSLSKLDFYKKNGYIPSLPENINLNHITPENISHIVKDEFPLNKSLYLKIQKEIASEWELKGKEVNNFLCCLDYEIPQSIKVFLTKYGPGGGYEWPDKISVLVEKRSKNTYLALIVHEIIHLLFEEPLVRKYNLNQIDKENLVDYMFTHKILKKIFPDYAFSINFSKPNESLLKQISWR